MTKEERFAERWAKAKPFPEWATAALDLPAPTTEEMAANLAKLTGESLARLRKKRIN